MSPHRRRAIWTSRLRLGVLNPSCLPTAGTSSTSGSIGCTGRQRTGDQDPCVGFPPNFVL